MLTDSSLVLITFINLFFVPLISLRIYCKRNSVKWIINFELAYQYALFCILNLFFSRIVCAFIEKNWGIVCLADSAKYTLVAFIISALLPVLIEIIERYVKIEVIIEDKKNAKTIEKRE